VRICRPLHQSKGKTVRLFSVCAHACKESFILISSITAVSGRAYQPSSFPRGKQRMVGKTLGYLPGWGSLLFVEWSLVCLSYSSLITFICSNCLHSSSLCPGSQFKPNRALRSPWSRIDYGVRSMMKGQLFYVYTLAGFFVCFVFLKCQRWHSRTYAR
jgi:hypothetical protein